MAVQLLCLWIILSIPAGVIAGSFIARGGR